MRLEVRGHPIHTRALAVELAQRGDGRVDTRGYILDLRKRGVVPIAADLQGPGVIHHMLIDAVVEPSALRLDEIGARQPSVAFEASAVTRGESCRDPIARIEELRGSILDDEYARRLGAAIGGPRGCSHILTLAQLLGSTVRWALAHRIAGERRAGERIFRRDVALDGHEPEERQVEIAIQVTDAHFAPAGAFAQPMSRFGMMHEVRALVRVDLAKLALASVEIGERRRTASEVEDATWRDRGDLADGLVGQSALRGLSSVLLRRLTVAPQDAPAYDALLMLAPAMIQCFATMSDAWLRNARDADSLIGMGGIPDSCYMWRRGGALDQARKPGDPVSAILK